MAWSARRRRSVRITVGGGVLERPDAQVAGGDPGEHRAGQHGVAHDLLAGRHHSQRPRRGDAECMHRLADHVLAQHRADGCLPITTSRERRATRALQVHVATAALNVKHLAEQERPTIAQSWREPTELMAGVRLRHRRRPAGSRVADENGDTVRCSQRIGIDTELCGQLLVEHQQPGRRRRRGLPRLVQAAQVTNKGVVELEQWPGPRRSPTQGYRAVASNRSWIGVRGSFRRFDR